MTTKKQALNNAVYQINETLGCPTQMFASKVGEPTRFNIGHLNIDKNATGYQLEEQLSEGGGTQSLTGRLNAAQMIFVLSGMILALSIKDKNVSTR